jgi:uncharacterized membrane protein (UPF0127 family)
MRQIRRILLALLLLTLAIPAAQADESTPLFYTRTTILIRRAHVPPPAPPMFPWQKAAEPQNSGLAFDVEVRDAMTLYNQEGWFNLSGPSENSGVLLAFSAPGIAPIVPSQQYVPLDILLIDKEGTIVQIIPNLLLSELQQDIYPEKPVLAFLYLKGGSCADLSISPGDIVEYKLFKRPPVVLTTAPAQTAPPPSPPAGPTPLLGEPTPTPEPAAQAAPQPQPVQQPETAPLSQRRAPAAQPIPPPPRPVDPQPFLDEVLKKR